MSNLMIEKFLEMRDEVLVGFEYLPGPIKQFLERKFKVRPHIPHVFHVTQLTCCLRKSFLNLSGEGSRPDVKGLHSIFRGNIFDRAYTSLFELNQQSFVVSREGVSVTGTYDFVYEDILYDLKCPGSIYYHKMKGAGLIYRRQVQSYLGLAHVNNELLDIHRCRVLMIAENVVVTEVDEYVDILSKWLFPRALMLDDALCDEDPQGLKGPVESEWECSYCGASDEFRKEYC